MDALAEACERRAWAALDALADMGGDVGEAMGQLVRSTSGAAYSPTWVRGLRLGCGLRPPPAREVWRPLDYVRHYAAHTCGASPTWVRGEWKLRLGCGLHALKPFRLKSRVLHLQVVSRVVSRVN